VRTRLPTQLGWAATSAGRPAAECRDWIEFDCQSPVLATTPTLQLSITFGECLSLRVPVSTGSLVGLIAEIAQQDFEFGGAPVNVAEVS
jgi:hypothetical protein